MILLIVLSVILFILALIKSNNKIWTICFLLLMWIMFAFSSNTADYKIYYRRFYYNYKESTEPLFNGLVFVCRWLGLNLNGFIVLMATIYIAVLGYFLLSRKNNITSAGFVLAMYFIYPFCMDVSQLRSTIGFILILIGIHFLKSDKKSDDIKFFICVLISTFIHYSGIFYVLLWIAKKINIRKCIIVTVVMTVVVVFASGLSDFMLKIAGYVGAYHKVWTVLNNSVMQQSGTIIGTQRMMVLTFVLIIFFVCFAKKRTTSETDIAAYDYLLKVNVLVMITLPLISYSVDLFRIQRYLLIITYTILANYIRKHSEDLNRYSLSAILYKFCCFFIPVIGLYLNIIRSGIFEKVILCLYKYNLLLE